jgi:hypothetical protein
MTKKSTFSTLCQSVFHMEDDGGPLGAYAFIVSVIKGVNETFLEVILKWDLRDSEVERFMFKGGTEKLIEWTAELNAFNTESAQYFIGLIKKKKEFIENICCESYFLTEKDLPELTAE